ncbi:MAG: hypothetical protein J7480_06425 [Microbacteriaceae bacterium]|nr:hypothetical protein [Microbacteriaceae bacterium]
MTAAPGNPAALMERANGYVTSAALIEAAAADLRALAAGGSARALDVLQERSTQAATLLDDAHTRYQGTAVALQEYSVALQAAHDRAERAVQSRDWNASQLPDAYDAALRLDDRVEQLEADPASPAGSIEYYRDLRDEARTRIFVLEGAIAAAEVEILAAAVDIGTAAELAIARIHAAISATNNTFLDRFGNAIAQIGEFFTDLWNGFVAFLAAVVEAVVTAIAIVLLALVALVAIIVAIIVLLALLVVVLAVVAAAIYLILVALVAILTSPLFWIIVLSIVILVEIALIIALSRAIADTRKPTPDVKPFGEPKAGTKEWAAWRQSQRQSSYDSIDDFMATEGFADRMGGDQDGEADARTVVDIKNMGGEPPHWVVTLPSTQDWQLAGFAFDQFNGWNDDGAVNDLDTNVALMLYPELRTQYERAVLEAMRQAGIGPEDPVMLVGFSQGGILAGHLAANRSKEYNFIAVLAYGAPIDAMSIPDASRTGEPVTVVSVQHEGDLVHNLDLTGPPPDGDHWHTYEEPAPPYLEAENPHNNARYLFTMQTLLGLDRETGAYSDPPPHPELNDAFNDFMGSVQEHKQYEFAE